MAQTKRQGAEPLIAVVLTVILIAAFETVLPPAREDNWWKLLHYGLISAVGTLLAIWIVRIVRYVRTRSARESADQINT